MKEEIPHTYAVFLSSRINKSDGVTYPISFFIKTETYLRIPNFAKWKP